MYGKVWAVSSDLKETCVLWEVSKSRFVKPSSKKPPKEVKVIGSRDKLMYDGSDLDCDIYRGQVSTQLEMGNDIPQVVLDYLNYRNKSHLILEAIKERVDGIIQESRKLSEASENNEESTCISSSVTVENES